MKYKILVVDDDPLICKGLKFNLERDGYVVETATNAPNAIEKINSHNWHLAILDIGLPGDDGLSLCRYIKANNDIPVLFLTARRRDLDEIIGLEIGADDYITKPFNLDVLKAHVKALLRRHAEPLGSKVTQPLILEAGPFRLDPSAHTLTKSGTSIELSPREFDLMQFFLSNIDTVFSSEEIVDHVWGPEFIGELQVLYVQIRSLREKVEDNPGKPTHILTLRGVGYKFIA